MKVTTLHLFLLSSFEMAPDKILKTRPDAFDDVINDFLFCDFIEVKKDNRYHVTEKGRQYLIECRLIIHKGLTQ